jgi:hypothetical protein
MMPGTAALLVVSLNEDHARVRFQRLYRLFQDG